LPDPYTSGRSEPTNRENVVPSNKRQRELARRRAERQVARRAEERARRRKRRTLLGLSIGGAALAVVLVLVLVSVLGGDDKKESPTASATPSASATPVPVACGGKTPPPVQKQTFKAEPKMTIDTKKTYTAHLKTSCGLIEFSMLADKAPHTTNSMAFLASKHYFDGTFCHRMTATPGLQVLQCGDPDGTGSGGPGYTIPEENLKGAKYTRGTIAMAKTSAPHSTGSQFFLVDKDSELPAQYTVLGHMTEASLKVLDKIAAIGIANGQDGPPKQRVYIESFTVTAK
jgi:peptidyl-prolyl cis-trans isomerase B (cyclophilin B)